MLEWDLGLRQETRSWLTPSMFWHQSSAFSPDERWCLSVGDMGGSVVKDMATGRETYPHFDLHEPWGLAFSHDGKLFAIASGDGFAKVFATDTFLEVATLSGFLLGIHGVAFSPDDTRLATGGDGQEAIRLWDTQNNRPFVTLEGRGSLFSSVAFSPDGSVLGAMNGQGVLHLWRALSWAE